MAQLDPLRQAIGSGGKSTAAAAVGAAGLGEMFSEQVGSALAKDPPREALVTALVLYFHTIPWTSGFSIENPYKIWNSS